jgi:hypothetical protein
MNKKLKLKNLVTLSLYNNNKSEKVCTLYFDIVLIEIQNYMYVQRTRGV